MDIAYSAQGGVGVKQNVRSAHINNGYVRSAPDKWERPTTPQAGQCQWAEKVQSHQITFGAVCTDQLHSAIWNMTHPSMSHIKQEAEYQFGGSVVGLKDWTRGL